MIRTPGVKLGVKGALVVEIAVAPIDRQLGGWERDKDCAGTTVKRRIFRARDDDDHLVPEARSTPQLRIYIGADSASGRGVEGRYVDNPHWV